MSLQSKGRTILLFTTIVMTVLFVFALVLIWTARTQAFSEYYTTTSVLLQRIAAEQSQLVDATHETLNQLAADPAVSSLQSSACSERLATMLSNHPEYANIGVIAPNGAVLCSGITLASQVNFSTDIGFQQVMKNKKFSIGKYQYGEISKQSVIAMGVPMLSGDGSIKAVLFAAVNLNWLQRFILQNQLPLESVVSVLDKDGTVLTRVPDPGRWTGKIYSDPALRFALTNDINGGTVLAKGVDGVERVQTFLPVRLNHTSDPSFYIIIGIPQANILAHVNNSAVEQLIVIESLTLLLLALSAIRRKRTLPA